MKLFSIATTAVDIALRTNSSGTIDYQPIYQARPGMKTPIIIWRNDKPEIVMAMWGLRSSTAYNMIHMSRVLKSRPWNVLIRTQRCAIAANCVIFEKNKEAYLVRLPQHRLFLMGGVVQQKGEEFHYTTLETESPDILASFTPNAPLFINTDHIQKWLQATELDSIFRFADKAGTNYFDYFKVNPKVLDPKENNRELLIPQGMTHAEYIARQKQVMSLSFEKERANRRNGK
jgi:putative SOS response-associated peptidase YedK